MKSQNYSVPLIRRLSHPKFKQTSAIYMIRKRRRDVRLLFNKSTSTFCVLTGIQPAEDVKETINKIN